MEHTKGDWTIETPCGFPYSGLYVVPVVRKDFPCYIAKIRQLREREESEANACLIVAAPDLLAACEKMQKVFWMIGARITLAGTLPEQIRQIEKQAIAAIAKANSVVKEQS